MQDFLLIRLTDRAFKKGIPECGNNMNPAVLASFFEGDFMNLKLNNVLNVCFITFEYLKSLMEKKTKRVAWLMFLERTVFSYIAMMLNACAKIKSNMYAQAI
jgi:hypothetical protein